MDLHIRPFTGSDSDYTAMTAARTAAYPEYPLSAAELRRQDEQRDPKCFSLRLVAELDGQLVGVGNVGNMPWMFHPQKFELGVYVHPAHRGRGVGGALYDCLMAELAQREPISLRYNVREDDLAGVRFAAKHGFVEDMRAWESRLDVAAFDPARFAGHIERVLAQGVEIATVAELAAHNPDLWPRFYELDIITSSDSPSPEPQTPPSFNVWRQWFQGPGYLPNGIFIAVADGIYVGSSSLWGRESNLYLDTGFTGVRREYRRRGIALALKLQAIDYARRVGAPTIRTDDESHNRGMLSINEALGFVRQPAWVSVVSRLRDE